MDNQYHYVYDRSQKREMRDEKEIGISAVRGGTIVGEHEVIFAGEDEVIEFKHTAYSKPSSVKVQLKRLNSWLVNRPENTIWLM